MVCVVFMYVYGHIRMCLWYNLCGLWSVCVYMCGVLVWCVCVVFGLWYVYVCMTYVLRVGCMYDMCVRVCAYVVNGKSTRQLDFLRSGQSPYVKSRVPDNLVRTPESSRHRWRDLSVSLTQSLSVKPDSFSLTSILKKGKTNSSLW